MDFLSRVAQWSFDADPGLFGSLHALPDSAELAGAPARRVKYAATLHSAVASRPLVKEPRGVCIRRTLPDRRPCSASESQCFRCASPMHSICGRAIKHCKISARLTSGPMAVAGCGDSAEAAGSIGYRVRRLTIPFGLPQRIAVRNSYKPHHLPWVVCKFLKDDAVIELTGSKLWARERASTSSGSRPSRSQPLPAGVAPLTAGRLHGAFTHEEQRPAAAP